MEKIWRLKETTEETRNCKCGKGTMTTITKKLRTESDLVGTENVETLRVCPQDCNEDCPEDFSLAVANMDI